MVEALLQFLDLNSDVPYQDLIIPAVFLYLAILWLVVSMWVYADAQKRFKRRWVSIVIAVANFLLQFPFLFVYLLIRPATIEDFEDWIDGGVNVPIVNFTGENGVVMSFELKINPKRIASDNDSEMKIDVSFLSDDSQKQVVSRADIQSAVADKPVRSITGRTIISSVNGKLKAVAAKIKSVAKKGTKRVEQSTDLEASLPVKLDQPSIDDSSQKHKKKRKKKRRK
ncbi:hypothetical protein H3C67_00295 [Candidatus Dojkabacteria bacterium]|uniref:Uncharacterized protein n=1 Tax=Candidatus Dojkabacteria bacterium TaxID=2099670 RepID=A0A952AJK9_9BACT|nr:hypothetical protein [Candidatus Dojkabacteria bacterium]